MAVPAATPVATPDAFTVATDALLLVHEPPDTVSDNVVVEPAQTVVVPVMVPAEGVVMMLTTLVAEAVPQLLATVYDIVAEPTETPLTTPEALTVAIPVAPELQVPPEVASAKVEVEPVHIVVVPEIVPAEPEGVTLNDMVAMPVPQLVVTI